MKKHTIAVVALVVALGISAANAISTVPMPYPAAMAEFNAVYAYTNEGISWIGTNEGKVATFRTNDTLYALKMTEVPSTYHYAGIVSPVDLAKMFEKSNAYYLVENYTNDNWQFYAHYYNQTNITPLYTQTVSGVDTVYYPITTVVAKYTQVWTNMWWLAARTSTWPVCSLYVDGGFATVQGTLSKEFTNTTAPNIGLNSDAHLFGVAIGAYSDGRMSGGAVGYTADAHLFGVAIGAYSDGRMGGVAVGYNANAATNAVAIGVNTHAVPGASAIGTNLYNHVPNTLMIPDGAPTVGNHATPKSYVDTEITTISNETKRARNEALVVASNQANNALVCASNLFTAEFLPTIAASNFGKNTAYFCTNSPDNMLVISYHRAAEFNLMLTNSPELVVHSFGGQMSYNVIGTNAFKFYTMANDQCITVVVRHINAGMSFDGGANTAMLMRAFVYGGNAQNGTIFNIMVSTNSQNGK